MNCSALRIGVDVGGTNTDSVLIDTLHIRDDSRGILAWHKTATTNDVSSGIKTAIKALLDSIPHINPSSINAVVIGTTHFINAVVQHDAYRLAPVAVVRLSGPYARLTAPGTDFPKSLANLICMYHAYIDGGFHADGKEIQPVAQEELLHHIGEIKKRGIQNIVVIGVFSPIYTCQEDQVALAITKEFPTANVVKSHEIATLGFLERENASILNASILSFAKHTIASFQRAIIDLHLNCPLFLTQNDGTLITAHAAAKLPIRTFNSGPTNSMRGAALLSALEKTRQPHIVVDVGGTTTEAGYLPPGGFPRQTSTHTTVGGVRMNFSMPDVASIGLGGGSLVRMTNGVVSVGPDSVGSNIHHQALLFGGNTTTATDVTAAARNLNLGNSILPKFSPSFTTLYEKKVHELLEDLIDRIKTTPDDIPVLLVGGGSIIVPESLKGVSSIIRPPYYDVANAVGAALAEVSAVIDTIINTEQTSLLQALPSLRQQVVEKAIKNGAALDSVQVATSETWPLPYIANKVRLLLKATGRFDFTRTDLLTNHLVTEPLPIDDPLTSPSPPDPPPDIRNYKPFVSQNEWFLSKIDLEFIRCGCYILGTGGGGTCHDCFLHLSEKLDCGASIRIVTPESLSDDAVVAHGLYMGSSLVAIERLPGEDALDSHHTLYRCIQKTPDAIINGEIGGCNCFYALLLGSSDNLNIPIVDGDFMGRAYPKLHQMTPCILTQDSQLTPAVISDGNGNRVVLNI